jgi:uncharacterized protein (TIGR02118 family)
VSAAFGTGLTGRLLLGERPLRWAEVARYVQAVRALVRGEEANWNGSLLRMSQPAGFTAARPADIAVLIAADGPKGAAVAADLGDGMLSTRVPGTPAGAGGTAPGGARRQVLLTFGTVLDDGEDAVGSRVTAAAGPALAAACHAICDWSSAAPYGLRRATQALTLAGAYRRGEPACDAIDELAFDDEASAARCLADAAFRRAWASDLLDPASVACLTVEEHVVKSEPVPASFVKNYEFVMKRPDMARDEFDRYWAQVHGPLAATIPTIRRYVQAHLSPGTRDAGTAPLDGLAITWFDDVAAMRAGAVTEAYARTRADERNFLAGELPFVVTTERPTFPCPDLGVAE